MSFPVRPARRGRYTDCPPCQACVRRKTKCRPHADGGCQFCHRKGQPCLAQEGVNRPVVAARTRVTDAELFKAFKLHLVDTFIAESGGQLPRLYRDFARAAATSDASVLRPEAQGLLATVVALGARVSSHVELAGRSGALPSTDNAAAEISLVESMGRRERLCTMLAQRAVSTIDRHGLMRKPSDINMLNLSLISALLFQGEPSHDAVCPLARAAMGMATVLHEEDSAAFRSLLAPVDEDHQCAFAGLGFGWMVFFRDAMASVHSCRQPITTDECIAACGPTRIDDDSYAHWRGFQEPQIRFASVLVQDVFAELVRWTRLLASNILSQPRKARIDLDSLGLFWGGMKAAADHISTAQSAVNAMPNPRFWQSNLDIATVAICQLSLVADRRFKEYVGMYFSTPCAIALTDPGTLGKLYRIREQSASQLSRAALGFVAVLERAMRSTPAVGMLAFVMCYIRMVNLIVRTARFIADTSGPMHGGPVGMTHATKRHCLHILLAALQSFVWSWPGTSWGVAKVAPLLAAFSSEEETALVPSC